MIKSLQDAIYEHLKGTIFVDTPVSKGPCWSQKHSALLILVPLIVIPSLVILAKSGLGAKLFSLGE